MPGPDQARAQAAQGYAALLDEGLARLDHLDPRHRASLDLILTELDRLPDAEELWLHLAARLEGLEPGRRAWGRASSGPQALPGTRRLGKAARWYARRTQHQAELRAAGRGRGRPVPRRALFQRPTARTCPWRCRTSRPGGRVRMVLWADWVRLKALERFPHSPTVFREAAARLVMPERLGEAHDPVKEANASTR